MSDAILFQNGRHVGFSNIVGEGAVAEDNLRIAGRLQFPDARQPLPWARDSTSSWLIAVSRQANSTPYPML